MNKLPLDAVKQCSHDNWGMPGQERPPFRSNYDELMEKCSASFAVETDIVETLQDAMINFYPSTAAFSSFTGEDWVPENHNLFPSTSPWRAMKPNEEKRGKMKGTTCDTAMDDGSVWSITRIGPIITTGADAALLLIPITHFNAMFKGCYDWAQVGWNNIFDFKEKLLKHPEGIFIYEQFSGPVTRTGEVLSHPPIHVHHIHVDLMNDAGV